MEVMPGYKQTDAGVIPEEWGCAPLSEFTSFISYGFTNPMPTVHDGIIMITAADIYDGRLQLESARKTTEFAFRTLLTPKSKPRTNDVLLTKDGTLGRLALVGNEIICINQSVAVIRPNEKVEPLFLKLLLESPPYQRTMIEDAGGSTIKHIYITIVDKMPIGLPLDKAEQRAIAEALSDVDALLSGLDQLIAKKRDLKQTAMQQLLTGQTRLAGFLGEWQVKCIGELTNCSAGGTPSTLVQCYWGGSIRWMSSGELNLKRVEEVAGRITEEGLRNSSTTMIPPKCVLVGLAGQGKTRGTVAMNFVELCTNQSIAAIFPSPAFVPEYLYYNLDNRYDEMRDLSSGDGGRGGLNLTLIKSLPVSLPPILEQAAIVELLTDMDSEIAALEQQREKTRALKQAMMQELLTGKTRLT